MLGSRQWLAMHDAGGKQRSPWVTSQSAPSGAGGMQMPVCAVSHEPYPLHSYSAVGVDRQDWPYEAGWKAKQRWLVRSQYESTSPHRGPVVPSPHASPSFAHAVQTPAF
jgi:hypothetical protein